MTTRGSTAAFWIAVLFGVSIAKADPLAGTKPLVIDQPLDVTMVDGIDRFALREIAASVERRKKLWNRDTASPEAYAQSIAPNREHLRTILGAVDPRVEAKAIEHVATNFQSALVARGPHYNVLAVRWPVFDRVTAEGLLLPPEGAPVARIVALPDADWTPEMFAGLASGLAEDSQLARHLVEHGCQVLVPMLISRDDALSGNGDVRYTNQPHREFIYRQAFEMGRHIIGYEVQKILAAVDQFTLLNQVQKVEVPIGVAGIGEGGLLALYSAAVDPRIKGVLVSGYFQPRENLWQEPIYRNVWALLREFGDAEIAGLVAPRGLVIESAPAPEIAGPPAPKQGRSGGAAPGKITTPRFEDVTREFERAAGTYRQLNRGARVSMHARGAGENSGRTAPAIAAYLKKLGIVEPARLADEAPKDTRAKFDPQERQ